MWQPFNSSREHWRTFDLSPLAREFKSIELFAASPLINRRLCAAVRGPRCEHTRHSDSLSAESALELLQTDIGTKGMGFAFESTPLLFAQFVSSSPARAVEVARSLTAKVYGNAIDHFAHVDVAGRDSSVIDVALAEHFSGPGKGLLLFTGFSEGGASVQGALYGLVKRAIASKEKFVLANTWYDGPGARTATLKDNSVVFCISDPSEIRADLQVDFWRLIDVSFVV